MYANVAAELLAMSSAGDKRTAGTRGTGCSCNLLVMSFVEGPLSQTGNLRMATIGDRALLTGGVGITFRAIHKAGSAFCFQLCVCVLVIR